MNSETPKVQIVIDKEYYERLLENQKTPEQARKFIKFIASTLRGFKGEKLWNHSEMADYLERCLERREWDELSTP